IPELVGAHAVIWTTTPWTIPVNQALAYGPEVQYVLVELISGIASEPKPGRDTFDGYDHPALARLRGKRVLVAADLLKSWFERVEQSAAREMAQTTDVRPSLYFEEIRK